MCLGIPGQIVEIVDVEKKLAKVDISGVKRQINITCIVDDNHTVDQCLGDWVLIHVGFAMGRIDEEEARKTMEILVQLEEAQKEMESMQREIV